MAEAEEFAAFSRLMRSDAALVARLRPIEDRAAFVEAAVAAAAARGFRFAAADVEAVIHANRLGWMSYWIPVP